jgi:hypothetical protein
MNTQECLDNLDKALIEEGISDEERATRVQSLKECIEVAEEFRRKNPLPKKKLSDKEKLAKLVQAIKDYVPYVNATIAPNNSFEPGSLIGAADPSNTKDWMAIHKGRASSSHNQLDNLLRMAKEMEND